MNATAQVLRRLAARRASPQVGERCQMCAEPIGEQHRHVVNVSGRQLMCVCRGCWLLFTDTQTDLRYRAVPQRYVSFPDFAMSPGEWDALDIPVGLAFFFRNSASGRTVAFYPGPAGAAESQLSLENWEEFLARHPQLGQVADDVEALLIKTADQDGPEQCLLVPIDACYELVGRIRMLWRGFDGGSQVRQYLTEFFATLAGLARPAAEEKT